MNVLSDNLVWLELADVKDHPHVHRWLAGLFAAPGVRQWWERNPYKPEPLVRFLESAGTDVRGNSLLEALLGNSD